jgi:hypothetical protein
LHQREIDQIFAHDRGYNELSARVRLKTSHAE